MPRLRLMLIGAGQRGTFAYAAYVRAQPDQVELVAVAEPVAEWRDRVAADHGIPAARSYPDWQTLLDARPRADAAIVATPDRDHAACASALLDAGYHVLLEKPAACTPEEVAGLIKRAESCDRVFHLAHVLRTAPFFVRLHEIVRSGRLGRILAAEHRENVASTHMAHSYVRGRWRRADQASPMLLAKCCHDLDLMVWNLQRPVRRLHSFGQLSHFRAENAPKGAPERCTDGCTHAADCVYDAQRFYLDPAREGWPVHAISADLSPAGRRRALQQGPFGRCVFRCDNDVVDHQTVSMELEDGANAVLILHGFSHAEERTLRYDGTRASLRGRFGETSEIEVHDHLSGGCERIEFEVGAEGHGGGDAGLMRSFIAALQGRATGETEAARALESHLLAFAAERSRLQGEVVDMAAYRSGILDATP